MKNRFYPVAFITLILVAVYIMYGEAFMPEVNLEDYKKACNRYLADTQGEVSKEEKWALVNQINYILPGDKPGLTNSLEQEVKDCGNLLLLKIEKAN